MPTKSRVCATLLVFFVIVCGSGTGHSDEASASGSASIEDHELETDSVCADQCTVGVGVGDTGCGVTQACSDHHLQMSCGETSCVCYEDDLEVGACESHAVCDDLQGLEAYAQTCCGW